MYPSLLDRACHATDPTDTSGREDTRVSTSPPPGRNRVLYPQGCFRCRGRTCRADSPGTTPLRRERRRRSRGAGVRRAPTTRSAKGRDGSAVTTSGPYRAPSRAGTRAGSAIARGWGLPVPGLVDVVSCAPRPPNAPDTGATLPAPAQTATVLVILWATLKLPENTSVPHGGGCVAGQRTVTGRPTGPHGAPQPQAPSWGSETVRNPGPGVSAAGNRPAPWDPRTGAGTPPAGPATPPP